MNKTTKGFTLIELIMVIVLLGALAGILSGVMGQFARIFSDTQTRSELTAKARLAMERMSREIRRNVPFGINPISSDNIEFVTAKTGGRYIEKGYSLVSTSVCKNKNRFKAGKDVDLTGLCFIHINDANDSPFSVGDYIVIGNSSTTELKNLDTVAKITATAATIETACGAATTCPPVWPTVAMESAVTPATKAKFPHGSSGGHFLVVENTHEIALLDDGTGSKNIYWKKSLKLDTSLFDNTTDVTNADIILIENVTNLTFILDQPKGILAIEMTIEHPTNGNKVDLYEEINIRNVP